MKTFHKKFCTFALASALGLVVMTPWNASLAASQRSDAGSFARGAKAWADNCGRCHNLRNPKEFNDAQWKVIVSHMRLRAGLTGQEARDVLKFLQGGN